MNFELLAGLIVPFLFVFSALLFVLISPEKSSLVCFTLVEILPVLLGAMKKESKLKMLDIAIRNIPVTTPISTPSST